MSNKKLREAYATLDAEVSPSGRVSYEAYRAWCTIAAELLRLMRENAEFRRAWGDTLLSGTGFVKITRIDPATVMLPVESQQEPPK